MAENSATTWRQDLRQDLARYKTSNHLPPMWWLSEKTVWVVAAYRAGQGIREVRSPMAQAVLRALFWPVGMVIHLLTGAELWPETKAGPGLRIFHGVGLVVHPLTVMGSNVTLYHGVTIGARRMGHRVAPVIGNDVVIGAHAVVLGDIHIGNDVRIGANTVVTADVPDGATVVGATSRVIERRQASDVTDAQLAD